MILKLVITTKPVFVYKDHPRDQQNAVLVYKWSIHNRIMVWKLWNLTVRIYKYVQIYNLYTDSITWKPHHHRSAKCNADKQKCLKDSPSIRFNCAVIIILKMQLIRFDNASIFLVPAWRIANISSCSFSIKYFGVFDERGCSQGKWSTIS